MNTQLNPVKMKYNLILTEVCEFVNALSNVDSCVARINRRSSEMFSTELFKQLRRSATVSPLTHAGRAVGQRQTDQSSELTQISILQVDSRLANDVVCAH